jgi:ligand-binding sensor domain-containing protein
VGVCSGEIPPLSSPLVMRPRVATRARWRGGGWSSMIRKTEPLRSFVMDGLRARHLLPGVVLVIVGATRLAAGAWAATTSSLQPAWRAEVADASALAVSEKLAVVAAQGRLKAFVLTGGVQAFDVDVGGKALGVSADAQSVVVTVAGVKAVVLDPATGGVRFKRQGAGGYLFGAAAGDRVVLVRGGRRAGVEVLSSQDGRRLWHRALRSQPASAPVVTDLRVFAADETYVHAFRRSDGMPCWRFALAGPATPIPLPGAVALSGTAPQFVTSVGEDRGSLRWTYRLDPQALLAPVAAERTIFVGSPLPGDEGGANRTLVRALRSNDGTLAWAQALAGEVTHLVALRDLVVAATRSSLHVLSAKRGLLLESLDFGEPIRQIGGGSGVLVVLGESGKLAAYTVTGEAVTSVTERELAQLAPGGPAVDALETLALKFARREIESAIGEALSLSGVLVVSRKVAADPLLERPVVALEILAEDRYLCRAKVAADGLEVLSWSNPRASAGSDYVDVSQAQAADLTRSKAPLPEGAVLSFARVDVDAEGKAYLDARWSAPGARVPQMEMRLHPRTGALISLVALWKLPESAVARWRQELEAYRSPASRADASVSVEGEPRSPLPGEIHHHRMSSQAYDAAFDGTSLWVTTNGGLYRVDPKTGEHHRLTTRDGLLDNELAAVASDRGGALWVASVRGLTRLREGRMERYPFDLPELRGREPKVRRLLLGGSDEVWAATSAGVVRWRQGLYTWFGRPHGLFNENVRGLARDARGVLWAATEDGLARFDGERWDVYREVDGLPQNDTVAVAVDRRDRVWVATAESGVGRFDGRTWKLFKKQTAYGVPAERGPPSDRIRDFALDTPGAVWGLHEAGLTRYFDRRWLSFPSGGVARGRSLSRVILGDRRMICVARGPGQGLVAFNGRAWLPEFVPPDRNEPPAADWVVASGEALFVGARAFGVARHLGGKWVRHNVDEGPHSGALRASDSAAPDGQGGLWVAARGALCHYDGQRWSCSNDGVGLHPVVSLSTDSRGVLWVGTGDAGIKRLERGRWAHFSTEHGLPSLEVRQVLAAPDQAVFALVAGPRGRSTLVRMPPGLRQFQVLGKGVGLVAAPTALGLDREGKVYVATAAATLLRWEGNQFVPERRYEGLPPAPIHRVVFDRKNHPWVIHDRGQGTRHHDGQTWVPFTRRTGLISDGARDLAVDAQGTVWVATDEGLTEYRPRE